ncbi:hypothetical protein FHU28_003081 [Micromonospora echinospora]|uniref:Sulfotransferase family protein n=1 Tax=Micromonospora echinospora TaxID=1877 RepID=A0ABR6MFY9_MICEC|nr:sulfotransferase [Micromonospora echinospora]MBB5113242.1 hypothetical protein [Micromonospora echinospora]
MSISDTTRPGDVSLDLDDLVGRAREMAGGHDEQRLRFLPALERLLTAVEGEAGLDPVGRLVLHQFVVGQLVMQIETGRLVQAHPEIERLPVENLLVITGMPRTGTTALHNLLAEHPGLRAPRLWEMLAPPASTDPVRHPQLIRAAESYVEHYYTAAPALRDLHPLDAMRPDECHRLTAATFTSPVFAQRYEVPGYLAWLDGQDLREVYEYHQTLLRCMLWRRPGTHVVLKCPSHLWHLDALSAVYPQARIVRLHRDPTAGLPSACNLTAVVRGANGARVDRHAVGDQWLAYAWLGLSGLRRGDRYGSDTPTLDVRQRDLRTDPLGVTAQVCDFAGLPMSAEAGARMARHLGEQAPEPTGGPGYSLADFGLDRDQIDRQFSDYRAEFGV